MGETKEQMMKKQRIDEAGMPYGILTAY